MAYTSKTHHSGRHSHLGYKAHGQPEHHGNSKAHDGSHHQVVQNKGAKDQPMKDPHHAGSKSLVPTAGSPAVEVRGTHVHAAHREGVTRPAPHNAGSHDHVAREHADHEMFGD